MERNKRHTDKIQGNGGGGCDDDDNNNSIQFSIYLRAGSTAIGLLQSQHWHIQEKQLTAQRQYTKTTYKNKNKWPVQASTKCVLKI
jgi:hypothetical protein